MGKKALGQKTNRGKDAQDDDTHPHPYQAAQKNFKALKTLEL